MLTTLSSSRSIALVLVAFGLFGSVRAEIDQNQPFAYNNGEGCIADTNSADLAQSFKQSHSNITGAGFLLTADAQFHTDATSVTVSLYDALPNAGGSLLASGGTGPVSRGSWADVSFGGVVPITAEQTYYLVIDMQGTLPGLAGDFNPYDRGIVYANSGYQPQPGLDFAFRTTYAPVPEPATMTVLGVGALAMIRRRTVRK